MQVRASLLMNNHSICASVTEALKVPFRLNDHQVDIEEYFEGILQGLYDVSAEGNRGNKRSVHDVYMKPISSAGNHGGDVLRELADIRRQNRRGNYNWMRLRTNHKTLIPLLTSSVKSKVRLENLPSLAWPTSCLVLH
jgi:hypothetical protein